MNNKYKEYAYNYLLEKLKKVNLSFSKGVSVITCTSKPNTLINILNNFNRQDFQNKELIIVINNDEINIDSWIEKTKYYNDIKIYKFSEKFSLGKCLNKAIEKSTYDTIAKFDDDDYYGPKYLSDTLNAFEKTNAKVIGKGATFVYFVEKELLAIRSPNSENKYVRFVNGSTLVFKKEVFNKVKFRDVSLAEDVYFCNDCIRNGIKIYSTNKYHHIYFRYPAKKNHTWKISDSEFMKKYCKVIGNVKDYINYANNEQKKIILNNDFIHKDYVNFLLNKNFSSLGKRKKLKIACILDTFSYECLKYEADFYQLSINNWKQTIDKIKPDLLFVESAWQGYNLEWINKIANIKLNKNSTLAKLVNYCKSKNIPTVFWAKEVPNDFYVFIEAAKLFEYVFTPDTNCIPKFKKILGHNKVYFLPLAVQPKLHNPIDKNKEKLGKVAFAGGWYEKFKKRAKFINNLLRPAKKYGLVIYNRFHYLEDKQFKYPDEFNPYIRKGLSYVEMAKEYKKYEVFLNVNSDDTSPTTFSRRIYELLACGIPVISSYNPGIVNYFKDIVMISNSELDTEKHLSILLKDKNYREKLSILGQREVLSNHTFDRVLDTVVNTIGLKSFKNEDIGVSVIAIIENNELDNILENYVSQKYPKKELILVIKDDNINFKENSNIKYNKEIIALKLPKKTPFGKCFNLAIEKSKYDFVSLFDSNSFYGANYLVDLMNTFKFTESYVSGKKTIYKYSSAKNLYVENPNNEYMYTNSISNSTIVFKKDIISEIEFNNSDDSISKFLKEYISKGYKIYSSDKYNYVYMENKSDIKLSRKSKEEKFKPIIL